MNFNLENALRQIDLKDASQSLSDSSGSLLEGKSFDRSHLPIEILKNNVQNILTNFTRHVQ